MTNLSAKELLIFEVPELLEVSVAARGSRGVHSIARLRFPAAGVFHQLALLQTKL